MHAGEAAGAESIAEAIDRCHADRIGHGTRLYEDPRLRDYVRDRRIALEINITSNLQTHAVKVAAAHPVRDYFDRGLNVTLCTDSWLMCGVSLTDEYWLAHTALGFTRPEIDRMILNGFESAFLPSAPAPGARRRRAGCRCAIVSGAAAMIPASAGRRLASDQATQQASPAAPRAARHAATRVGLERFRGLLGLAVIIASASLLPQPPPDPLGRRRLGVRAAVLFAIFVLRIPAGQALFRKLGDVVTTILGYSYQGSQFVFGELGKQHSQPRRRVRLPDPPGDHLRLRPLRHHVLPRRHAGHRAGLRRRHERSS